MKKQTHGETVTTYLGDQPEVVAEMLRNCNDALIKCLFRIASGARENNANVVRRYLRKAADDLAQHGYETEASVITKYLEDLDVHPVIQD